MYVKWMQKKVIITYKHPVFIQSGEVAHIIIKKQVHIFFINNKISCYTQLKPILYDFSTFKITIK